MPLYGFKKIPTPAGSHHPGPYKIEGANFTASGKYTSIGGRNIPDGFNVVAVTLTADDLDLLGYMNDCYQSEDWASFRALATKAFGRLSDAEFEAAKATFDNVPA